MSEAYADYEKFIASFIESMRQRDSSVSSLGWGTTNKLLGVSGQPHQVDISFIDQNGTEPELVIIECKRLNKRVSLDLVKVVKATTDDLRFNNELPALVKPFILTTVGFQSGAKLFADYYDINTQIVNHGSNFSFQYRNHSFEGILFSRELSMQISVLVEAPCYCCGKRFTKENNENYCQACLEIMRVEDC